MRAVPFIEDPVQRARLEIRIEQAWKSLGGQVRLLQQKRVAVGDAQLVLADPRLIES